MARRCRSWRAFAAAAAVLIGLSLLAGAADAQFVDRNCSDFPNQQAAQLFFLAEGGPESDPHHLDGVGEGDGRACTSLPCPCYFGTTPPPAEPEPAPPVPAPQPAPEPAPEQQPNPEPQAQTLNGRITAVVDGDTLKVAVTAPRRSNVTVRLIGIDTPETRRPRTAVECGGKQATSNMYRLAFTRPRDRDRDGLFDSAVGRGRPVTLRTDPTQDTEDRYGRLLAYVTPKGRPMLQLAQLQAGWAAVYVYNRRPFQQLDAFQRASDRAKAARRGAFKTCSGNFHKPA